MRQCCGQKRFVWNRALAIEQARYRRGEKTLGCKQMTRELTQWREQGRDTEFLREPPVHALPCVIWELYESYQRFFAHPQEHPPQFKKKSQAKISFTEADALCFELDQQNRRLKLPKLGWMKCRYPRPMIGKPNSITVKFAGGRWLCSVQTRQEVADPVHPDNAIIARDFGVIQRPSGVGISCVSYNNSLGSGQSCDSAWNKEPAEAVCS
jgi:putative transposase